MNQRQKSLWRHIVFALLLCACAAMLPQNASAEKTDWKDNSYDFSRVKRVLVYDVDLSVPDFSSSLKAHKYQSDFPQYAKKMGCEVLTEEQARRRVSLVIGVDLDALAKTDPAKANQLFTENLSAAADAYVKSRVLKWENSYYIKPAHTEWEQQRVDRSYRDREDYAAQDGMYERICKSFFSDFGNKIH